MDEFRSSDGPLTVRISSELSGREQDQIKKILATHATEVKPDPYKDPASVFHSLMVFWQAHGEEIKTGVEMAMALWQWLRERSQPQHSAMPPAPAPGQSAAAQPTSLLIIARPGEAPLDLTSATEEQVRAYFRVHQNAP